MIKNLQKIGLSEKEAKIYLAILELGPSKIPDIAKKAKIKRTTVYVVVESLIQKGLVSYFKSKNTKKFVAEEPRKLSFILKERQDALKQIMPQLQALVKNLAEIRPEVRFYEGREGCLSILEQTLDKPHSEVMYIGSVKDIYKIITREYDFEHYIPARVKKDIKFKALVFFDRDALLLKKTARERLREVKFLPEGYFFPSSMFIFQDKIALLSSIKELIGVVIQSPDLAKMEEQKFKLLCNVGIQ